MKSYTIHFVRHGLTPANEKGVYAGSSDYPLSSQGKVNLHNLKEKYEYPDAPILYSSPLKRCIETAGIIYPDKTPIVIEQLKECCFGDWEGKTFTELEGNKEYYSWLENRQDTAPPHGESGQDFGKRVCSAFDSIITGMMKSGNTNAIIVTHGGVIMSILSVFAFPRVEFYDWIVDNGCGYSVRITPSLWMRDKVMEVYDKVPVGNECQINGDFKFLIDKARQALKK